MRAWELFEGRDAPLYMAISSGKLSGLLDSDTLVASTESKGSGHFLKDLGYKETEKVAGHSMTRNPNLSWMEKQNYPGVFTINQNKLSQKHKIIPLDADYVAWNKSPYSAGETYDKHGNMIPDFKNIEMKKRSRDRIKNRDKDVWAEEFVVGSIPNFSKYVVSLKINHNAREENTHVLYKYAEKYNIAIPEEK